MPNKCSARKLDPKLEIKLNKCKRIDSYEISPHTITHYNQKSALLWTPLSPQHPLSKAQGMSQETVDKKGPEKGQMCCETLSSEYAVAMH